MADLVHSFQGLFHVFKDKRGIEFPGVKCDAMRGIRSELRDGLKLSDLQIAEGAGYSLAMVVRYALGLDASDGDVSLLIRNGLPGMVTLAGARHLKNAGCSIEIILIDPPEHLDTAMHDLLAPLLAMGSPVHQAAALFADETLKGRLASCHNAISGLFSIDAPDFAERTALTEMLNDIRTPVHVVECPSGIDPDSGAVITPPLYASSTLSLGLPLSGLLTGNEYVGRHYLCDISIPRAIYQRSQITSTTLFSEQPVIQIFPAQMLQQTEIP